MNRLFDLRRRCPRSAALCLLTAVSALAAGWHDELRAEELLLKAARVHTMTGEPLEPAAVLVRDGKIAEIGPELTAADSARVIDFGDATIVPGLINAYSHAGVAGGDAEFTVEITPDFDVSAAIDWGSRDFRELLDEGITSVGIAPGTENVVAGLIVAAKTAGTESSHRLVNRRCGLVVTLASDPRNRNQARIRPDTIYVRQPTNRMGVVWLLRSSLDRARRSRDKAGSQLAAALAGKLPVFAVSRTHHDLESLLGIADEFHLAPRVIGGEESYKLTGPLSQRRLPVILGPLSTSAEAGAEGTQPAWGRAGLLRQAGVEVAFSGSRLLEQARFAVRFGLPRDDALRAVTTVPAALLGIDNRVGRLAQGLDADMLVLSGDPFEFTTSIHSVIVDGVVYQEGTRQ